MASELTTCRRRLCPIGRDCRPAEPKLGRIIGYSHPGPWNDARFTFPLCVWQNGKRRADLDAGMFARGVLAAGCRIAFGLASRGCSPRHAAKLCRSLAVSRFRIPPPWHRETASDGGHRLPMAGVAAYRGRQLSREKSRQKSNGAIRVFVDTLRRRPIAQLLLQYRPSSSV